MNTIRFVGWGFQGYTDIPASGIFILLLFLALVVWRAYPAEKQYYKTNAIINELKRMIVKRQYDLRCGDCLDMLTNAGFHVSEVNELNITLNRDKVKARIETGHKIPASFSADSSWKSEAVKELWIQTPDKKIILISNAKPAWT